MTSPETARAPQSRPSSFLSSAMTGVSCVVLFLTGLAVGVLSGFGMGWFAHYWSLGLVVQAGIVTGVLVYLALLYALCRLAGWGSRRQSGAVAFAAGYVLCLLGMVGYVTGGTIVFSAAPVNYLFLFGSMAALGAGAVRSAAPPPARPFAQTPQVPPRGPGAPGAAQG